jgi:hypothetical protein
MNQPVSALQASPRKGRRSPCGPFPPDRVIRTRSRPGIPGRSSAMTKRSLPATPPSEQVRASHTQCSGEGRRPLKTQPIHAEVIPPGLEDSPYERRRAHLANLRGRPSPTSTPKRTVTSFPVVNSAGFGNKWSTLTMVFYIFEVFIHEHCCRTRRRRRDEANHTPAPQARIGYHYLGPLADQWVSSHDPRLDGRRMGPPDGTTQGRPGMP